MLGRDTLPVADQQYTGEVFTDAKDSCARFEPIQPLRPPAGAPNVLVILLDDVGFGAERAFGGPCYTPTAERLARQGLSHSRFHTTALCAPTRQALLTGRNHHAVGWVPSPRSPPRPRATPPCAPSRLLADAFEQMGYQPESPSVRNSFLAAALELRSGTPTGFAPKSTGPDLVRALSTLQFLDFLGIRLAPDRVGDASFTINLVTPDNGESFVVELNNGTLTSLQGFTSDDPDLTLTVNRSDLENAMTGAVPLQEQVAHGTAVLDGDGSVLVTLAGMMADFPLDFAIMPGTPTSDAAARPDPFAQRDLGDSSGG